MKLANAFCRYLEMREVPSLPGMKQSAGSN
jgi:hypothetical protein